ncbi:MAG: DUF5106 domain-containing protein [Saprospiraceae bacterium]|nr:DUF5106 domain-containing protein [Saprospiraceae bacterium]
MMTKNVLFLCFLFCLNALNAQIKIEFNVKNYDNDTIIIGNYYGEKTVVKDTLIAAGKGKFTYTNSEMLAPGMYIALMKPDNSYIQFLVNGKEKDFKVMYDKNDLTTVKFSGSAENNLFYGYLDFLKDKREIADTLKARIARAESEGGKDEKSKNELDALDKEVTKYQKNFIEKNAATLTGYLIKSNMDIDLPEFEGEGDELQMKRYLYYREHFFDNIDFTHPALIRMPFLHPKVNTFVTKLSSQQPDSLIKTVDYVLAKLEPNQDAYRYYLADFLNQYAQMKMVGLDAIYVHLVDNYYSKGKASWVNEENLQKMQEECQ